MNLRLLGIFHNILIKNQSCEKYKRNWFANRYDRRLNCFIFLVAKL